MTLIFSDARNGQPSTHALVIGVGGYRHLDGGSEPRPQTVEKQVGLLRQLNSPPRSAVAFAQFLLDKKDAWRAPLGSLDLLISTAPNDTVPLLGQMAVDQATMANIRAAYTGWRERCNSDEDNIAVFYFCGHGLEKTEQYLLADDFGADPLNPWLNAFAFDSTRLAFHGNLAKTQCFFVDACRDITSAMLQTRPNPPELETVAERVPDCDFNLTMKATARNQTALGPKRGVSYFTQALITALGGAVATQGALGWAVESGQIGVHITDLMRMIKQSEGFTQRCSSNVIGNTELLQLTGPPKVNLNLACVPEYANGAVELSFCQPGVPAGITLTHQGAPWSLVVDVGAYVAEAHFASGNFGNTKRDIFVMPPPRNYYLNVTKVV